MNCKWCDKQIPSHKTYCSKRCRQTAYRFRRRLRVEASNDGHKRLAYADPPYPGTAKRYYGNEESFAGEVDHKRLLERLATFDGWALSTSARALRDVLPLCPPDVRICSWVKPIGVPSSTMGLHSTWEPLIVKQARMQPPGMRDWLSAQPARYGGKLVGRKPIAFCAFLFRALGAAPDDDFADLFPGTGIVSSAWREFSSSQSGWTAADDGTLILGGA